MQNTSLCALPKRMRGSYTDSFQKVSIMSNHFQVKILADFEKLYIFAVKFEPNIPKDNRSLRKQILDESWSQINSFIVNPAICGMNLISNKQPLEQSKEIQIRDYKVTIKQVKVIQTKEDPRSLLFFLNNRLRNVMAQTGYTEIGRTGKYFNIKSKKQIDNLNMYSGFKANFCILQKGIFLRVDSAKKIVRNQTVLQFIDDLYSKHSTKDRDDKRNIYRNQLKDKIIQVSYGNGRYYKIEDIIYQDIAETFIEGEKINMIDYYKKKYNLTITKLKQPLIKVQNKKGHFEILLVPEFCLMTGIPEDFDEMKRKKISEETILDARTKNKQIMYVMDEIKKTSEFDDLKKVGIEMNRKMHDLSAKMIPTPKLALGEDQKVQQGKQAFFNLFSQPIFASKHKIKLAILYFRADLRDLIRTFDNTSKNLRIDLSHEKFQIKDERRAIDDISKILRKANENGFNLALIVIPNHMRTQYKRIKEVCLIENKMLCQVFTEGKLRNKNAQSICTKVLLQIVAKRGNTLWVPKTKSKLQDVMLIGIDNAKLEGNKNVLAACGTVNATFTSVYSRKEEYLGNDEKFGAACRAVLDIVNYYVDRNKVPPKQIILFSNSCSGDQVKSFKQFLIDEFLKKAEGIYHQKLPSLQVVMVNTKTSERFFTSNCENVRAGTLVNSDIVSPDYDFYLVSQNSNRGCIVPNHYKVIFTNSKIQEGVLEQLIFSQCFNYVNWSGSIKVPGILQYAKKCAKFNSEVLNDHSKISDSLQRCLYFV